MRDDSGSPLRFGGGNKYLSPVPVQDECWLPDSIEGEGSHRGANRRRLREAYAYLAARVIPSDQCPVTTFSGEDPAPIAYALQALASAHQLTPGERLRACGGTAGGRYDPGPAKHGVAERASLSVSGP